MSEGFGQGFRLSPQQRRLLLLQQAGGEAAWRARCEIRVEGDLEEERLWRAVEQVAARWEILRTVFPRLPGVALPVQEIRAEPPFPFVKLEGEPAARRLVVELPGLCSDAAGAGLLARDVAVAYLQGLPGAPPAPRDEPMQYADLAEWQHELLGEEQGTAFWRRQDLGEPADVDLPDAVAGLGFEPRVLPLPAVAPLAVPLAALADRLGVSAEAVLLAAWQVVLRRSTGHPGFVVGLVCDGRRYEEVRDALGPLSRHVPLRCPVAEEESFAALPPRVEAALREAVRHQEYHAAPDRAESFLRFSFEALHEIPAVAAAGVTFRIGAPRAAVDRFTVQLGVVRGPGGLQAELRFDAGALAAEAAEQLARRFETLLGDALARPQAAVGELALLGEDERRGELEGWQPAPVAWPDRRPAHRRIEEQARRHPGAPALLWEAGSLTFAELNERANRLAHHLRSLGVGPEVRVGVRLDRSPELVVAVLAVLKAGGAFVPLDPDYPEQRLAWMLAGSGAQVLLDRARLAADAALIAACPAGDVEDDPYPENLAYVIFTSGSTGAPKGVGISHAALANYLSWLDATYPLGPADRLLLKAAFSFDVAVRELLWPAAAGAGLVIAAPGGQRDAAYLADLIARFEVSVANFVPSMLASFLDQDLSRCAHLSRVLSGGEALPARLRDRFFARLASTSLHNHYGPTEATITATWWTCERGDERRTIPIGRPLANVRALLLDRFLDPVPAGVPGALAVGGAGLARGYLGDPAATARVFVPDPHAAAAGGRLYLTGDLARRLPGGSLEFLGRGDDQVKVRGFRIEPAEIEFFLGESPRVASCAVAVHGDGAAERRLVAYVVPTDPRDGLAAAELREWLLARLPEHMVPAAFVRLEALPLTPGGKLDRRALPAPDPARPEAAARFVAPRDPVEEAVAGVWAEVLKLDRVGVEDEFFALGGHSLLAMQVVSRLQETFRAPLQLRALFEENTVEKLARALAAVEPRPGQTGKIARALKKVREMSAESVRTELAERRAPDEAV